MQQKQSEYNNIEFTIIKDMEVTEIHWQKGQAATFGNTITIGAGSSLEVRQIVQNNTDGDFGLVSPIADKSVLYRMEYKDLVNEINNQPRLHKLTSIVEYIMNKEEE